jgi:hypothetical protein
MVVERRRAEVLAQRRPVRELLLVHDLSLSEAGGTNDGVQAWLDCLRPTRPTPAFPCTALPQPPHTGSLCECRWRETCRPRVYGSWSRRVMV